MIPLAVPNLTGNEKKYLDRCIDTTFVSSVGEFVNRFEEMTAQACGTQYSVASSAGTTGLHLALLGCGVLPGDIVIIPSFTFIATANAVAHCGATPWLMDIDRKTWTMDAQQLEEELHEKAKQKGDKWIHKASGKRIAAIMPVYTLGNIPDMVRIRKIAEQYKLPVIADAACAIGASYQGEKVGRLADLHVFSFNGNKTLTAGGGGCVAGDDENLIKLIKHLSTTARVTAEYDFDMVGYNYRMTNIQAAVGCAQLERLTEFVEKKRAVRQFYKERFAGVESVDVFPDPDGQESSCWFSGIVLKSGGLEKVRVICAKLKEEGIEARSFWKPIHLQKPYKEAVFADSLAETEALWDKIVTLPCSTNITEEELAYVAGKVIEVLQKEGA